MGNISEYLFNKTNPKLSGFVYKSTSLYPATFIVNNNFTDLLTIATILNSWDYE